jgi:hypothetical protein
MKARLLLDERHQLRVDAFNFWQNVNTWKP